jgi:hypothetical protein
VGSNGSRDSKIREVPADGVRLPIRPKILQKLSQVGQLVRHVVMNTGTTTGEYMLLFRGPQWDRGLSTDELQQVMDKVIAWFEGLNERGKVKGAQPLGGLGRVISGTNGRLVVDGPFTETKEAVGGYLVLEADSLNEAVEVARSMPTLRHGISIEVRPILAECPIFQRHPELVRRATDRAAEQLLVAAAA